MKTYVISKDIEGFFKKGDKVELTEEMAAIYANQGYIAKPKK